MSRTYTQTLLLLCGLLGGILFFVNYSILGWMTPGYSALKDTISGLETARSDGLQQANFIFFGLLNLLYAIGLAKELIPGANAKWIILFQVLTAVGLIGDGFLIHDPMHMACDLLTFNSAIIVLLLFTWQFRKSAGWHGWRIYSILSALCMIGFLTAFGMANHAHSTPGLYERLAVAPKTIWTLLFVGSLFAGKRLRPAPAI